MVMLTNEQIVEISKYLNYSFAYREYLTHILNSKSTKHGESWDTEVSDLLTRIATAKSDYESSISEGGIKRTEISGELAIEYMEGSSSLKGLQTLYYNLLGELFRLIELRPYSTSNYKVR